MSNVPISQILHTILDNRQHQPVIHLLATHMFPLDTDRKETTEHKPGEQKALEVIERT
jgi:hypothetical protein